MSCEGLHRRGHDVTLISGQAIGPEGELLGRAFEGGYKVIVLDSLRREINPFYDWWAGRQLSHLLGKIKPDIMHSHSSKAGILARRSAFKTGGMKIVHTIHGLPFHRYLPAWWNRLYVALERRAAQYTDAIVSVADAMTDQALAEGVGNSEQFTTIYSGMEIEPYLTRTADADRWRQAMNLSDEAVLVTQVSRLAELKGHEYIIQAAGRLDDSRLHFCFVGDGLWRRRIEATIARLGLADRFHLTGLVSPQDIPALMHASDIVVHCSLREGLARALPQAMLAGKPVISFDVDGAKEIVKTNMGILLQPKDVPGLTAAIQTLAGSPPLRQALGQAGRELCRGLFDHNQMVDKLEDLYNRLLLRNY